MSKPWVDQEACIGCGLCVTNVPDVFRLANHNKAEVFDPGGPRKTLSSRRPSTSARSPVFTGRN